MEVSPQGPIGGEHSQVAGSIPAQTDTDQIWKLFLSLPCIIKMTQDSIMPLWIYMAKWLPISFNPPSKAPVSITLKITHEAETRHAPMQMA